MNTKTALMIGAAAAIAAVAGYLYSRKKAGPGNVGNSLAGPFNLGTGSTAYNLSGDSYDLAGQGGSGGFFSTRYRLSGVP